MISVFLENNDKILSFPFWDPIFFQNMHNKVHFYAKKRAFFDQSRADTVAEFAITRKKKKNVMFFFFSEKIVLSF